MQNEREQVDFFGIFELVKVVGVLAFRDLGVERHVSICAVVGHEEERLEVHPGHALGNVDLVAGDVAPDCVLDLGIAIGALILGVVYCFAKSLI